MNVVPFPAAPEPEPEPATPPLPNVFDTLVRSLIEACGEKTAREALNDLLDMPAKDVLKELL